MYEAVWFFYVYPVFQEMVLKYLPEGNEPVAPIDNLYFKNKCEK